LPLSAIERSQDLGEVILLPGLVNAHCHLDYTSLAGQLAPPASFTDWIKLITAGKAGWLYSDFAESWLAGAQMLVRNGVTTVGDIEMAPELLPEIWAATPLRVLSFLEMTGVKSRRAPRQILREATDKIALLPAGRCRGGLSPHAPYSTTPELLRLASEAAHKHNLRVVTHVAESTGEFEMFMHGRGEMYHWLARSGRDMSDCALGSPIQHLERHGALNERLLAVHVNCLAPGDAALLARRKVSVVHCPRSHAYFQHPAFPLTELSSAKVNICLGTDSLASVYKSRKLTVELNLFDEMRAFAGAHPAVTPKRILEMATTNAARALGLKSQAGELSPGAFADFIALPFHGKIPDAYGAILHHRGNVAASIIDGQWAVPP
jgi:cytosine/adenosine deaminase-related metal-dependent hydrolase